MLFVIIVDQMSRIKEVKLQSTHNLHDNSPSTVQKATDKYIWSLLKWHDFVSHN